MPVEEGVGCEAGSYEEDVDVLDVNGTFHSYGFESM